MPTPPAPLATELVTALCGGWWSLVTFGIGHALGRRTAPRRYVDIDGMRSVWAQEAQLENKFKAPDVVKLKLPEKYTEVAPGHYVRFSWRKLSRTQWKALLETTATAQLTGAGKPFSRAELEQVRDLLIKRGCARWRNVAHPAQGWELSRAMGRAIARHLGMALPLPRRTNGNTQTQVFSRVHARVLAKDETK